MAHIWNVWRIGPPCSHIVNNTIRHHFSDIIYMTSQLLFVCQIFFHLPKSKGFQNTVEIPVFFRTPCVVCWWWWSSWSWLISQNHTRHLKAVYAWSIGITEVKQKWISIRNPFYICIEAGSNDRFYRKGQKKLWFNCQLIAYEWAIFSSQGFAIPSAVFQHANSSLFI